MTNYDPSAWIRATFLIAVPIVVALGCGGPSTGSGCHYESWQGKCKLTGVRTSRVVERFPQSFVVVEATYEPESTEGAFAPPPFRKETMAPADNEGPLTAHLRQYAEIDCAVDNPVGDPCMPKMHANVPAFVPETTQMATGPVGCAKIERSGISAPPPGTAAMPGPFQFAENSSAETPDMLRVADAAAAAIRGDGHIECVAIKAKTAPGEPFELSNERAQAVRRLLEARGIEHAKLTIFESSAPTYSAAPDQDQAPLDEQRRVNLTVVVYGGAR